MPRTDSYQTGRKHKNIELDRNRAMYWIGVGAQPSEPIRRLLSYVGFYRRPSGETRLTAADGHHGTKVPTASDAPDR